MQKLKQLGFFFIFQSEYESIMLNNPTTMDSYLDLRLVSFSFLPSTLLE